MSTNEQQPNMYRVTYKVMEGDNYAGGWGTRTADVKSLDDIERFKHIESVVPIYKVVRVFDDQALSPQAIQAAIEKSRQAKEEAKRRREVELAEKRLEQAKARL